MRRRLAYFFVPFLAAVIIMLILRARFVVSSAACESRTEIIMATPVGVLAPSDRIDEAAAIVFGIFRDVEARMSEWRPASPLSKVNDAAGDHQVEVPADLRALLHRGIEIGEMTGGAFDLTWAALWRLWDFNAEPPAVPSDDEIAARLALVDYRLVEIDDQSGTVYLPKEGMLIGLGGIAKGCALDRAAAALRAQGIDSFLISAGGQMMAGGMRGDRPWRIGIRDPRGDADDFFAFIHASDLSVSTSGDYERFFIADGRRYHHILDPRTGRPARGLRSATIICPDATLADALSTALLILGKERGLALVQRASGVEAVLVDEDGRVHLSAGAAESVAMVHDPAD